MTIMNIFFKSEEAVNEFSNLRCKTKIDFIIVEKVSAIKYVTLINKVNTRSNHRKVICKVKLDFKIEKKQNNFEKENIP